MILRRWLTDTCHGVVLALQFLTRIPVPLRCPWTPSTCRAALRAFPLIGVLIGVLLALVLALGSALPAPLLALLLLTVWVALSGGLHLDGVMDLADALGSNAPMERRWAILKDSQIGSFAVLVLVFLLAWKGMLLWALIETGLSAWLLVLIPALARFGGLVLLRLAPPARGQGLAAAWREHLQRVDVCLSMLPVALLMLPFATLLLLPTLLGSLMLLGLLGVYALLMVRLFAGINGDMIGAAIELGELWLLMLAWSWWWFVMA